MEGDQQRKESQVEMPAVRGEEKPASSSELGNGREDDRSCYDCREFKWKHGFPHCNAYDKPTSGRVNGCSSYAE